MKEIDSKPTIRLLRSVYCGILLTAVYYTTFFETDLLEIGQLAGDDALAYWVNIIGVALTLALLPLALRLMKIPYIRRDIKATGDAAYTKWAIIRLTLLATPLHFNLIVYYLLGCEPTSGYLALIAAVAFIFVWPSRDKMLYEMDVDYVQEES